MLTGSLHYCTLLSKEFLLFTTIPVSIETVTPIRTPIAICLIIPFAVHAFEDVRIQLTFFSGCLICFLVLYITLCFLSVIFSNVSSITLSASGDMRATA